MTKRKQIKEYTSATRISPNGWVGSNIKVSVKADEYVTERLEKLSEEDFEHIEILMTDLIKGVEELIKNND